MEHNILDDVLELANTAEWSEFFDSVLAEHVTAALEEFGLELAELQELLGEQAPVLLLLAYEDFQSRAFGPEPRNILTEFLQRNERNLSTEGRAWLEALRDSVLSLYKVISVTQGESFTVRDELLGSAPVEVMAESISEELDPGDTVVMRIVQLDSEAFPSEGVLSFDAELAAALRDELAAATAFLPGSAGISRESLRAAAPLFSKVWLSFVVPELSMEPPQINTDGEVIAGQRVRFPLASGVTGPRIAEVLDAVPELQRTSVNSWDWIAAPETAAANEPAALEDGFEPAPKYLGDLELEGRDLVLTTNSVERGYRGLALVRSVLGELVREPVSEAFGLLGDGED
jgi:hypothetical protein